jgi:DNA-binding XRE family transcriptional regulator
MAYTANTDMTSPPSSPGDEGGNQPTRGAPRGEARNPEVHLALVRLGERIKLARVSRDISLKEMARKMNLNAHTLGRLEKGAPGVAVETLALVLWHIDLLDHLNHVADPAADATGQRLLAVRGPNRARGERATKDSGFDVLDKL